ncbi:MULE transposase domain [Sesbania bispinosa]|nr:MULE transposase domain [Sesbania bispinosa]
MATQRKMTEFDIMEMNSMRSVGISVPDIYASFANRCGGYDRSVKLSTFGDVLSFDATYGRNKYRCPLVIFSGVNHHNSTIVFGSVVVANETEDTYVWLLEQFKDAMKGKSLTAVITDGDMAMRNAIRKAFPEAHHHLCAWHLLRNATANAGIPGFVDELEKCIFANVEVAEFYRRAVFAGLRTTSRCERLHGQLGKFIKSRYNFTEFVQHFQRCLCYMRYKEEEDDFACMLGEAVFRTNSQSLERSTSTHFTRNIFFICRKVLFRTTQDFVVACRESAMWNIYTIKKYQIGGKEWEWIISEIQRLKDKYGENLFEQFDDAVEMDGNLQDPVRVRTKGCGHSNTSVSIKGRRKNKCN